MRTLCFLLLANSVLLFGQQKEGNLLLDYKRLNSYQLEAASVLTLTNISFSKNIFLRKYENSSFNLNFGVNFINVQRGVDPSTNSIELFVLTQYNYYLSNKFHFGLELGVGFRREYNRIHGNRRGGIGGMGGINIGYDLTSNIEILFNFRVFHDKEWGPGPSSFGLGIKYRF